MAVIVHWLTPGNNVTEWKKIKLIEQDANNVNLFTDVQISKRFRWA